MSVPQKPETDQHNIEVAMIGIRKYEHLKSLKPEDRTAEQILQIEIYESKQRFATPEQIEKQQQYFDNIHEPKEQKLSFTARQIWDSFTANFERVNGRRFEIVKDVTVKNLEPLIYYFAQDDRFFDCENLSKLSEPSFDKGLLIIGNFGNGKTSAMRTLEFIFKGIPGFTFKGYSANEVVTIFEKCSSDIDRTEFDNTMYRGTKYFDDLKTERIASNYGKVNLFKEILEIRESRFYPTKSEDDPKFKLKTFVTSNFKDGFPDDLVVAIDEFEEKYGSRVYDRLFSMFNILEFKGKSFRR